MKQHKEKILINRLWDWLEEKFRDTNMKLDHILFRLRKEDPRIYQEDNEKYNLDEEYENYFKGI